MCVCVCLRKRDDRARAYNKRRHNRRPPTTEGSNRTIPSVCSPQHTRALFGLRKGPAQGLFPVKDGGFSCTVPARHTTADTAATARTGAETVCQLYRLVSSILHTARPDTMTHSRRPPPLPRTDSVLCAAIIVPRVWLYCAVLFIFFTVARRIFFLSHTRTLQRPTKNYSYIRVYNIFLRYFHCIMRRKKKCITVFDVPKNKNK